MTDQPVQTVHGESGPTTHNEIIRYMRRTAASHLRSEQEANNA